MFLANDSLLLDGENPLEARRRKALAPDDARYALGQLQGHLVGGEVAVGFDDLREVGGRQQAAGDGFEGVRKFGQRGFVNRQARRCRMATEFCDESRMALGYQVQRIAQMQRGDRAAGAFERAVLTSGEDDGRAMEAVLEAGGENADHALVPVRLEEAQGKVVPRVDVVQFGQGGLLHVGFYLPAFPVQRIQLPGDRARALLVIGDQAFDAERYVGEPAGGVQARPQHETQVVAARPSALPSRHAHERPNARTGAAGTDAG